METSEKFKEFIDYLNSLTLKDKDLYAQYYMMKSASKILDERTDELQSMILEEMNALGVEKQKFEYGSFTVTERKSWKYSDDVKEKELTFKEAKKKEEEDGIATCEIKKGLLFR